MACDYSIAQDLALFGQAGPKHGSAPDGGSTDFLPLFVGVEAAMESCTACDPWTAHAASRLGLLTRIVPALKIDGAYIPNPLAITDRWVDPASGRIVYGERKSGEALAEGKALLKRGVVDLGALDAEDLEILASLTQDAVFPATEMTWDRPNARFALLLNRFRWEEGRSAAAPERVQSVLAFDTVTAVATSGIMRGDADTVLSLLSVDYSETEAPSGHILLTLAGDGAIRLTVETIEATLKDVTKPYVAPSGQTPKHPD